MSVSLLTRTIDGGQQAVFRLRDVLWAITQAAAAAALAWYIAHNLLGHPDPFFAPIAAAGAISASNVLHVQRAIQNISGVALGIIVGAVAQLLLGTESIAIALAVFVSLCVAVLVGHGFLGKGLGLGNQAAGSAVLVAALSGGDQVVQRLQEALIGSGVALAFTVLLFPVNPLTVLRDARVAVLGTLHDMLAQLSGKPGPPHAAADRVTTVAQTCAVDLQEVIDLRQ
ncbi:FUSC family protein [Mycobacterium sp.]|uniref:FUSC family protein n=1 Tax=Mycobacterium sp. TaxID=1785 RepID=UPI003C77BF69